MSDEAMFPGGHKGKRNKLMKYSLLLSDSRQVKRFIEWVGPIPHPYKEINRRLLQKLLRSNLRWSEVKPIVIRIKSCRSLGKQISRKMAKEEHAKARTAPHFQRMKMLYLCENISSTGRGLMVYYSGGFGKER